MELIIDFFLLLKFFSMIALFSSFLYALYFLKRRNRLKTDEGVSALFFGWDRLIQSVWFFQIILLLFLLDLFLIHFTNYNTVYLELFFCILIVFWSFTRYESFRKFLEGASIV